MIFRHRLLGPRLLTFKNKVRGGGGRRLAYLFLLFLGIVFWGGLLALSLRVLTYFSRIDQLGEILAFKLLSMVGVTLFFLMIFSSLITGLSKYYLSHDLPLVHALPVAPHEIMLARWSETTFDSAWMMVLFSLPILAAYGMVFQAGWFYYLILTVTLFLLSAIAAGIASVAVMLAVIIIPASRIRTLFIFFGLLLFIGLYVGFRILRPERLVDPETFSLAIFYLKTMKSPTSPFLPSTWAYDAWVSVLTGRPLGAIFHVALASSFLWVILFVMTLTADQIYFSGFSKSQASKSRLFVKRRFTFPLISRMPPQIRALVVKEVKIFFRDPGQWSQLFLIAALMGIYIYNFKVLPLERSPINIIHLQHLLAFLNQGLALFVLTAVAGRFAFPAVSQEGAGVWLIRHAPLEIKSYLWVKFFIYLIPLFSLTLILIVWTNHLLGVRPFMMVLSLANVILIVPGVVALAVGLGAVFADFKAENPSQVVTGYGGILFMILCALYIGGVMVLEAGPVYQIFLAEIRGIVPGPKDYIWAVIAAGMVLLLAGAAFILPLGIGARHLESRLS